MVLIDTSAWIEFFNGSSSKFADQVQHCLDNEIVCIGDLIYCELLQGFRSDRAFLQACDLLDSLNRFELVGFHIAKKSAMNYRLLRQKGVTVRKTIDVFIGTFCIEHNIPLLHHDRDFKPMIKYLGLKAY